MRRQALISGAMVLALACGPRSVTTGGADGGGQVVAFRGLLATPTQLAFTCVTPGCTTTYSVKISSNVNRRVAVKRVVLSSSHDVADGDYTVTPDQKPPFILGAAADFTVQVQLKPTGAPGATDPSLLVTYTDASADDSPDRIEPGEVAVPLVRRLVGEPVMTSTPPSLSFGLVPAGTSKSMPLLVRNAGFGNIALAVDRFDAGALPITVTPPPDGGVLVPDAGAPVGVVFAPASELYLNGVVEIASSTPGVAPVSVAVEGTSYSWPKVTLQPEERAIDFGPVPKGGTAQVTVHLANIGGQGLSINQVAVTDALHDVSAQLAGGVTNVTLDPLGHIDLTLLLDGGTAGELAANLTISSNDPARPSLQVPITGTVTAPTLLITPDAGDWGTLPQGWVVAKSFELRNVGWGPMQVKSITFVGGSSNLFTLKNLPALPTSLQRDERVAFDVEFRAEVASPFNARLSVETDDPVNPIATVPLKAVGAPCSTACPIAHGTAACTSGVCGVGSCSDGWYDTNQSAADGCECALVGTENGNFCAQGVSEGTLSDSGSNATGNGNLPVDGDVDYFTFLAYDASQVFGDDFDVRVRLQTSDPSIQMCVYWQETSSFQCTTSGESCGSSFEHSGSYGHDDTGSYAVKIFRKAGAAPTCTAYTVYMSNG